MRSVLLGVLFLSSLCRAGAVYEGRIDLTECGRDRVADPETYRVRFTVETERLVLNPPTQVSKVTYVHPGDICTGTEDCEYDVCQSEIRITGAKFLVEARTAKGLVGKTSSDGAFVYRKTVRPDEAGRCPKEIDFTGDVTFYWIEGKPRLEVGRGDDRLLSIGLHSNDFVAATIRKASGTYTFEKLTFSPRGAEEKRFYWEHSREPYATNHYCSGTARAVEAR